MLCETIFQKDGLMHEKARSDRVEVGKRGICMSARVWERTIVVKDFLGSGKLVWRDSNIGREHTLRTSPIKKHFSPPAHVPFRRHPRDPPQNGHSIHFKKYLFNMIQIGRLTL